MGEAEPYLPKGQSTAEMFVAYGSEEGSAPYVGFEAVLRAALHELQRFLAVSILGSVYEGLEIPR